MLAEPIQTTLEEGVPLSEVTFCVVDLETTGGSPRESRITEVGAVRYRAGERLGDFQALVNPGESIPPRIARLTGIDDGLVAREPAIEEVLPAFLEFARGTVFVAHNARFDFTFLNENLRRLDYALLPGPAVCTARLARRVVWPDVPNVKLQTLARYFATPTTPVHRALADADACAEVLHGLLDLGGRLGILTLGDLRLACAARGRPHFGKIRLADHLPHAPGVYLFKGRDGRVLYVGKSKDVRGRVKSYFYGDARKKVQSLLREVVSVEGVRCEGELEALVLEARLIGAHEPRYNRRGTTWRRRAYLRVADSGGTDAAAGAKVVRTVRPGDGCRSLGPFPSSAAARLAKEALATIERERSDELVGGLVSSLTATPGGLLEALEHRMADLATEERFEDAARARDRLRSLVEVLARGRQDAWLVGAARLELTTGDGLTLRFDHGTLRRSPTLPLRPAPGEDAADLPLTLPCPRERADELAAVRSWLSRHPVRITGGEGPWPSEPVDGGADIARLVRRTADAAGEAAGRRSSRPRDTPR